MPEQLSHQQVRFQNRKFPVILVCDSITYQANIGSLFRICEAFGVEKIIFIGKGLVLTPRKINRTSRTAHLRLPYEILETAEEAKEYLLSGKYTIIALEITDNSIPLRNLQLADDKPIVLIAGSEVSGISQSLLAVAGQCVHIEMYGENSSMNVVQAVAIALFEITDQISQ